MKGIYYLMHEDTSIARFNVVDDSISCIEFVDFKSSFKFIPCGVIDNVSFKRWITERSIQTSRGCISRVLHDLSVSSVLEFMLLNKGVSLCDHYWLSGVKAR